MLFADKLGMPKKIKDLAESLDLEVTNHHDPEFDAKLCALIFGELTDKYPSYQELIRKIDDQPKTNNNYFNQPSEDVLEENEEHLSNYQITQNELENIDLIGKGIVITGNFSIEREEIKTFLMKIGGQIKSGITGKVDFVFAGEDCGWSKIQKINDLNQSKKANIRILNEADLNYLIPASAILLNRGESDALSVNSRSRGDTVFVQGLLKVCCCNLAEPVVGMRGKACELLVFENHFPVHILFVFLFL